MVIRVIPVAISIWLLMCIATSTAQDFGWRGSDGKFTPDTESRKTSKGFAGWLLTTSDPDWEAKWNTPEHETPAFNEADTVRKGETVYTLIFLVNPKVRGDGEVEVRCDLRVVRPDGTLSIDEKNVECMKGTLPGNPYSLRLAAPVLGFVGEAADPVGTWNVEVTLRDVPRGVTMVLRTSFKLLDEEEPKASSQGSGS